MALVLGVRAGERVWIGNKVSVIVKGFQGKADLIIDAPKSISIQRDALRQKQSKNGKEAGDAKP